MTSNRPDETGDHVVGFDRIDRTNLASVGGKGANLGELSRIDGVRVPGGFCVTTHAYARALGEVPAVDELLDQLAGLTPGDRGTIQTLSADIRTLIGTAALPTDVAAQISDALGRRGDRTAWAVRSSASAEDLPGASFAGQHDSYLNVVGTEAVLDHVRRCWASLFSERAVSYRLRNGFDHRQVRMAVVVQQMVDAQVAGIVFTADPATSDRTVSAVESTFGLGDALVSGRVNPDVHRVRNGTIIDRSIAADALAVHAAPGGGTVEEPTDPGLQDRPALTDDQVLALVGLGRAIEAHFGSPQDIEWCLLDGEIHVVQSRPITTLFPIPPADDDANHVYVSVGHQQMMTDAMRPLGLSLWQMTTPAPMSEAGGRLFVDITDRLAAPSSRADLLEVLGRSDPLIRDALQDVLDRGDFIPTRPDDGSAPPPVLGPVELLDADAAIVGRLIGESEASIRTCRRDIRTRTGPELFDFIESDIQELRRVLFDPRSRQVYMTAMEATEWLNRQLLEWLGEKNVADVLTQSVPNNVTSEMGLALLDVADVIRPHPDVIAVLENADDGFLDRLDGVDGGADARHAIEAFLDRYGMRCVGEIDITRPRWGERPTILVPVILAHVEHMEPGEARRRFEDGRRDAATKEAGLLERLRALPDGHAKAAETKRMIDRVRTFIGYREYPKYGMVSRYHLYKQALMAEARRLVERGVLDDEEDIHFLRFDELRDVVRTGHVDGGLVADRRHAFESYQELTAPRVLTSDGEALNGRYRRDDLPDGALAGLAVSGGTVEGRARVVLDIAHADPEPGDILVTTYTDPSWTPLFVTIAGLVTEVGGMMTHGAVIAREYGLPAVVGVEGATRRVEDGQRIRLNGTDGYIEVMPSR